MAEKDWIRKYFAPLVNSSGANRLRDDVAVLDTSARLIVTTDALVEGVHFRADDPLETVAHKLVRVNVSDCLASGAHPSEALLTLGWPKCKSEADLVEFARGLSDACAEWEISLIGGDTVTHSGALFVSLVLTGTLLGGRHVRRDGASIGDDLWVSGLIGAAKLGYEELVDGRHGDYISSYQMPDIPPLSITGLIARCASAAMDVSDGLLIDSNSLAEVSSVLLKIDLDAVPFAGSPENDEEKIALASWGDDYQCLFTAPSESRVDIENFARKQSLRITRIGEVAEGRGIILISGGISINLPESLGFEHN